MTLENLLETGNGDMAVRLVLPGLGTEFVSDLAMQRTTADGRVRVCALPLGGEGIVFEEQVNLPEAKLEVGGISIRLFETRNEDVSGALRTAPDITRWLASNVDSTDTTLSLLTATGISPGDVVHLGTEAVLVGGVSGGDLTGCTRGYWDTIAQDHFTQTGTARALGLVTNRPIRIRGRRALLYLYGTADDLQGDGSLRWTGEVNSEPQWVDAGLECTFQLASVATRMEQSIGGELAAPATVRGVYYSWAAPLRVRYREVPTAGVAVEGGDLYTGFAEDQNELLGNYDGSSAGSLNEFLLATGVSDIGTKQAAGDFASTLRATIDPQDPTRWTFEVVVGAGVFALELQAYSPVDGEIEFAQWQYADGSVVTAFNSGDVIYPVWAESIAGARQVPRGYMGTVQDAPPFASTAPDRASTWPETRLYLATELPSDLDTVSIEWATGEDQTNPVRVLNTTDNYIETAPRAGVAAYGFRVPYTAQLLPSVAILRTFATGSLADFRDALASESINFANRGTAPFLPAAFLGDWAAVVSEVARGRPELESRVWQLAEPVELFELLQAEFLLTSTFPVAEADGRLGLRVLRLPNQSVVTATPIDEEINESTWSTMSTSGQTLNRFLVQRGYNPREDEYTERTVVVSDVQAVSLDQRPRPVEIAPKSRADAEALLDEELLAELLLPRLTMFGFPYHLVPVKVDWRYFNLLLGDVVSFTADHLPGASGRRGLVDVMAIVVRRRWEMGNPEGELTLLFQDELSLAGYSPTARVTSQVNVSGNTWNLTINNTLYAPTDPAGAVEATVDSFFEADDVVRIVEYDSESPTVVRGTVVSSGGGVVQVTFDSAWTPSTLTWELIYASQADVQESQKRFAFIDGNPVRVWGP